MCYCHHIEMISFIKFLLSFAFFLLQRRLGEVLCLSCLLKLALNFNTFDRIFVDFCWGFFSSWTYTSSVFLGVFLLFVAAPIIIC
jgi:amino acid permease